MSSPTRRERAAATRERMLAAAHELFTTRGYTGTRMADVAAEARVAVQTVYFTFHTKAELLQACYERAVFGPHAAPPPEQPWYAALLAATDGAAAIGHFVAGNTEITARAGLLDDVVRSALHEPEAIAIHARSEQLRRMGYRGIAEHLAGRFGLRSGLDVDRATDVMLMLGDGATYRSLVLESGWSREAFEDWLTRTLTEALLG